MYMNIMRMNNLVVQLGPKLAHYKQTPLVPQHMHQVRKFSCDLKIFPRKWIFWCISPFVFHRIINQLSTMRIYSEDPPHIPYVSVKTCHCKPPVLSCQATDGHMLVKRKGHRFIYPLSQPLNLLGTWQSRQPWRLPLRRGTVMIIERFHYSLFKMNKCLRSYADSKT